MRRYGDATNTLKTLLLVGINVNVNNEDAQQALMISENKVHNDIVWLLKKSEASK